MIPASYPRPPIVEAVVEIRVAGGAEWAKSESKLLSAFQAAYPGPRRQVNAFQVETRWQQDSIETNSRKDFLKWLLPDASGRELVGLGPNVHSLHVLAPYPGWAKFRPAFTETFKTYCAVVEPKTATNVGVRYIDQIVLPVEGRLDDFFRAIPPPLPSQPDGVTAFQTTTESYDPETKTTSLLTLASGPAMPDGQRVVIYDLNLTRQLPESGGIDDWSSNVEELHTRQRAIFEDSITDRTRELFS